jgi:predicted transcriptional regulator
MNMLTVTVSSRNQVSARARAAFAGKRQGARISFPDAELLWKVLGTKRLEILRAMAGKGAMSIRGVARAVGRDVKAVHGDIGALLDAGIIDRAAGRGVVFLFDAIHVDFLLEAA